MTYKKLKYLFYIFCFSFLLTGCSFFPSTLEKNENTWADSGSITVGNMLTVQNTDDRLALINHMDTLSADGLYYASWAMGSPEPFQNSAGDMIDLYDAQFYLLLGEFPDDESAKGAMGKWLAAGKANYDILSEEEIICNGQPYTFITYQRAHDDIPYHRGVSAFGQFHNYAVCIELTCKEDFEEDLTALMNDFLNACSYKKQ